MDRQFTIFKQSTFRIIANNIDTPEQKIAIQNAFPSINFKEPTCLKFSQHTNENILYVSEKSGKLYSINLSSTKLQKRLLIDISKETNTANFNGLLGFEIDVECKRIYLHYNSDKETVQISVFESKSDYRKENKLLTINPVYHSGGTLVLDKEGSLFISIGDSRRIDSDNSAQDLSLLQGKLLKIIPDTLEPEKYHIPKDNPFVKNGNKYREEIYAYGFRNPFRFSIDSNSNEIYLGDVGENEREEINRIHKGANYGWSLYEGNKPFKQKSYTSTLDITQPIYEYKHGLSGFSITCGMKYRGTNFPFLKGSLLYADYVRGAIWTLSFKDPLKVTSKLLINNAGNISSFSSNREGEVYFTDLTTGNIMKLIPDNSK
ncbi:PQQ-dependent sugar dehydrogenase [Arcticibacterium luteifluviistationis]|uniref:PQQ-dependent sugar dehydrogenase n=1 Tax=Arcticibacterium luteifluviistationis TaxID=1784714 RepID=UPI0013A6BBB2|nr:PQQ-dependent sugar dehydrogenase [Arcticibacterium luteifluviistationis]